VVRECRKIPERRFKILIWNARRSAITADDALVAQYFFPRATSTADDARLFLAYDKRDTPWPVFTNGIISLSATAVVAVAVAAVAAYTVDRVQDNETAPDAERAQMTSVCHTHEENYHFKFVNVHSAAIRRRDGGSVRSSARAGRCCSIGERRNGGKDDGSGHYYDNTVASPRSFSAHFGFCVSASFRSVPFLESICCPPSLSPLLLPSAFFFSLQHNRARKRSSQTFSDAQVFRFLHVDVIDMLAIDGKRMLKDTSVKLR